MRENCLRDRQRETSDIRMGSMLPVGPEKLAKYHPSSVSAPVASSVFLFIPNPKNRTVHKYAIFSKIETDKTLNC